MAVTREEAYIGGQELQTYIFKHKECSTIIRDFVASLFEKQQGASVAQWYNTYLLDYWLLVQSRPAAVHFSHKKEFKNNDIKNDVIKKDDTVLTEIIKNGLIALLNLY